jgi:hypothetical protein
LPVCTTGNSPHTHTPGFGDVVAQLLDRRAEHVSRIINTDPVHHQTPAGGLHRRHGFAQLQTAV